MAKKRKSTIALDPPKLKHGRTDASIDTSQGSISIEVKGAVLLPDKKKEDPDAKKARKLLDERERKAKLTPKQRKRLKVLQERKAKNEQLRHLIYQEIEGEICIYMYHVFYLNRIE